MVSGLRILTLYRKLPEQNQLLIQAIQNAQKQNNPTTHGIAQELQNLTQTPTNETWISKKLQEAQNTGLITQALVNREDKPALVWRSQLPTTHSPLKLPKLQNPLRRH